MADGPDALPLPLFGSYRSLYALGGGKLLRCSGEFREKIYPLLEAKQQTMYLARKDLPTFCGCVLPALDGQVEIEDPQILLQNYIPDSCTACFYFDMEQDTLLVKPVFRYDTHSIAFDDSSEPDGVRRNKKKRMPRCCSSGAIFSSRDSSSFYRARTRPMIFSPVRSTLSAAEARSISVTA